MATKLWIIALAFGLVAAGCGGIDGPTGGEAVPPSQYGDADT